MKARFYLRENKVSVYVTINGKKNRFATGIQIESKNWTNGYPKKGQTLIIERIQRIEKPLNEHLATNEYTSYTIKCLIDEVVKGKTNDKNSLKVLLANYITYKKVEVEKSTFSKIETHILDFQLFASNRTLSDLNPTFFAEYRKHLQNKQIGNNTLNSYIKNVQTFFNWLFKMEHISKRVSIQRFEAKDTNIIAINDLELEVITSSTGLSAKLERIKDLFLFGCYTGLRFSDLQLVTEQMINNNILTIRQQKTSELVQIPLIREAKMLLEKYNYQLPKISNQKANINLKELFNKLELNRLVYKGIELKTLDKVVTFHVARKSFITIALSKGIHAKVVQSISGHKNDAVFNRYIAFSTDTLTTEMNKMSATHLRVVKEA